MADVRANAGATRGSRRPLVIMTVIALAPIVLSTIVYFFFPQAAESNYGKLLPVGPAPEITGSTLDGAPWRLSALQGRWVLLLAAPGQCEAVCQRELYATRQARTMQGAELDRVVRVWLVTDGVRPADDVLRQQPGLVAAQVDAAALARFPAGGRAMYLIDPLGNLVLQYPEDPDIKALAKDLRRLLRASSIG